MNDGQPSLSDYIAEYVRRAARARAEGLEEEIYTALELFTAHDREEFLRRVQKLHSMIIVEVRP